MYKSFVYKFLKKNMNMKYFDFNFFVDNNFCV